MSRNYCVKRQNLLKFKQAWTVDDPRSELVREKRQFQMGDEHPGCTKENNVPAQCSVTEVCSSQGNIHGDVAAGHWSEWSKQSMMLQKKEKNNCCFLKNGVQCGCRSDDLMFWKTSWQFAGSKKKKKVHKVAGDRLCARNIIYYEEREKKLCSPAGSGGRRGVVPPVWVAASAAAVKWT